MDRKNLTVILPINGFAATFHINTIKNASKSDEGEFTFLRINLQTPGQLAGKKEDTVRKAYLVLTLDLGHEFLAFRKSRRDIHSLCDVSIA